MLGIENIYQNGDRRGGYSGPFRYLAFYLALPSTNGQPEKERDWPVTIPRPDGSVIFMVFVAAQAHFERFEPTYAAMLKSVRF